MTGEAKMWRELMQQANPGWGMSIGRKAQLGQGAMALDTYVYLVDVSTAWTLAGALSESEFRRLVKHVDDAPELGEALKHCANGVCAAADADVQRDSDEAEGLIASALGALSRTNTFQRAQEAQRGSITGHWMYLVYRLRDGSALGRPGFTVTGTPGLLSPDTLIAHVQHTVAMDLGVNGPTSVGQMIYDGGGTSIAESYRS